MCVLFMSWWVTYWQIEHCLPIPRLVGGSKLPGARIPSRKSLLSEIYLEMKYWYQCFARLLQHPILIMMASSVCRNSGDENHVVMNEKVQALAGSIYEEFEKMLQRWQDRKSLSLSKSFEMFTTKVFLGYVWHQHMYKSTLSNIDINTSGTRLHDPIFLVQVWPGCCEELDASHRQCPWVAGPRLHRVLWVRGRWDCFSTERSEFEEIEILWERFSEPLHSDPSCQSRSAKMLCGKIHLQESTYPSVKI